MSQQQQQQQRRSLRRQRSCCVIDQDKEWERRRQLANAAAETQAMHPAPRLIQRCISDCSGQERRRRRSITDADLDELRGCIDLGFGFDTARNEANPGGLWDTIPALELCYAVSHHFDPHSSDDQASSSACSSSSSSPRGWPGDEPDQVKMRLRHWARAVALTLEQQQQQL